MSTGETASCHGLVSASCVEPLEDIAADLWRDARLRAMTPAEAAQNWLEPVACADGHPRRHSLLD
ncbi:hypothetical protein SAMN05444679_12585 [Variovorax sp. CF079]|nr:hypothetical protein SAMN05444679_12585 [Variovorax sp. CF079]